MSQPRNANPIPPAVAESLTRDGPAAPPAPVAKPGMRAKCYVDCSAFDCELVECMRGGATVRFTDDKPEGMGDEALIAWDDLVIYARQQLDGDAPAPAEKKQEAGRAPVSPHAAAVNALGTIELKPGMVIADHNTDEQGIVLNAFNDQDFVVYRTRDAKVHGCRISDVMIEPRPAGGFLFTLDNFPTPEPRDPDQHRREKLRHLDDVAFALGDAIAAVREMPIEDHWREFIRQDRNALAESIGGVLSDLYSLRSNVTDELIGRGDIPAGEVAAAMTAA